MPSATAIRARRRLNELFMEGVELRFFKGDDGLPTSAVGPFVDEDGQRVPPRPDDVAMFIRPADPLQREMAVRSAQAKRAAALVRAKREKDSEEHLTIMAFLADMDDETLIDYVVITDSASRMAEAERETLARDEWEDMLAYQDAMRRFDDLRADGKSGLFEGDAPEDPDLAVEWKSLERLDERYREQVTKREHELNVAQHEALRFLDRSKVEQKALEKRAEMVGSQAFMYEYEKQMKYYSVREVDDPTALFFESPDELAAQPDPVRDKIDEVLLRFIGEAGEAKNSSGAADSSGSSVPPAKPVTSESSTPEEQSA